MLVDSKLPSPSVELSPFQSLPKLHLLFGDPDPTRTSDPKHDARGSAGARRPWCAAHVLAPRDPRLQATDKGIGELRELLGILEAPYTVGLAVGPRRSSLSPATRGDVGRDGVWETRRWKVRVEKRAERNWRPWRPSLQQTWKWT